MGKWKGEGHSICIEVKEESRSKGKGNELFILIYRQICTYINDYSFCWYNL